MTKRTSNLLSLPSIAALSSSGSESKPQLEKVAAVSGRCGRTTPKLWTCAYLPRLAIDALCNDETRPLAVSEQHRGKAIIHACNRNSQSHGIEPAMPLASALALCQNLQVFSRNQLAEQHHINRLAQLAYCFSDSVCIYTPNSIVFEIKSSLRLFGGIRLFYKRFKQKLREFGGEMVAAIAPTPRAALWLCQSGDKHFLFRQEKLVSTLRKLPISCLVESERKAMRLRRSGIATIADILRLPRDGVARRFGTSLLSDLDQALGKQEEPLNSFYPAKYFSASLELYMATDKVEYLLSAASKLLTRLEQFLEKRRAATQQIRCEFSHHHRSSTTIDVGSNSYMRHASQFQLLLGEHFQNIQWEAEVTALTIRCDQYEVFFPEQLDLFNASVTDESRWCQLLERFRVRLGERALRQFHPHPDHRPERAYSTLAVDRTLENIHQTRRPLWFLPSPQPLKIMANRLYWHGPLSLEPNIECVEQGWWDGGDIRRDYRIAHNPAGSRLWIFQDVRSKRWFLQGLFG